jgi:protein phosphatase
MSTCLAFGNFLIGSACDVGRKRDSNQDALGVFLPEEGIALPPMLVIADGMGGHHGGEIASRMVIEKFHEIYVQLQPPLNADWALRICVERTHQLLRERAAGNLELQEMGSTVVAAFLGEERVDVVNVGDSRAYILCGRQSLQISTDQSWVMDQVRAGMLTPSQARRHSKRNQLTMSLNPNRPVITPVLNSSPFEKEDILLLCSDGLWDVVPEAQWRKVVSECEPQEAAERLVALANQRGGPDNISVIVARRKGHAPR